MILIGALLGVLIASAEAYSGYGGYGALGGLAFGGGYGGYGVAEVVEPVAPVIPVSGGLVGERSFVDSFIPGSSYGGFGTYGPAYGGLPYPLEAFGPVGIGGGYYY